jgi:AcrR family transcriptional regulator
LGELNLDKKQEIIKAAYELFCEKGYHLSLSEIANAVGIKTPSLYSHFSNKDEILDLMIQEEIYQYYRFLEEKIIEIEPMNIKDAMKNLFIFFIDYFSEYKRLRFWRTIPLLPNEQLRNTSSNLIKEKDKKYKQQLLAYFMKGVYEGEINPDVTESTLHLYLCMIQGVLDAMLLYPNDFEDNILPEEVFEAYWEGISAKRVIN